MREKGRQWVLILGDEPRIAARDESEQRTLVLYGSPSTAGGGIIDAFNAGDLASESSQGVRQLNGQFAALVETSDRVLVSTDRFASHQVFLRRRQWNAGHFVLVPDDLALAIR